MKLKFITLNNFNGKRKKIMKIESDTQHSHKTKQRKKIHPIHKSLLSPILLFLFIIFD